MPRDSSNLQAVPGLPRQYRHRAASCEFARHSGRHQTPPNDGYSAAPPSSANWFGFVSPVRALGQGSAHAADAPHEPLHFGQALSGLVTGMPRSFRFPFGQARSGRVPPATAVLPWPEWGSGWSAPVVEGQVTDPAADQIDQRQQHLATH